MWLLVCVVAIMMAGHPGTTDASSITIRAVDTDANVSTAARFVGLAYNLLKADPDAVDSGLRRPRRVVDLTPDTQESFSQYSCGTQSFTSTVYDEQSFQRKFDLYVKTEAGVSAKVVEAKFSLSASFSNAKDQTTKERKMTMETETLCYFGGARLKTEMGLHKASQEFQSAVCQLPDTYNQAAYVKFIDDWGTNYAIEVDVGVRTLTKKTETFSSVYQSLQKQFGVSASASANYSRALMSVSGSIEMNMKIVDNSQELREAFKGNVITKVTGTERYPEPIRVILGSIHSLVTKTYFDRKSHVACTSDVLSNLTTKQANLARALDEYPAAKQASVSVSDGKVRIPLKWPKGTYGLVKPKGSCPAGWASDGCSWWESLDAKESIANLTAGHHFDGYLSYQILLSFCVKTPRVTNAMTDLDWPVGEYCIYKYRVCPAGFSVGTIYWDDENSNYRNTAYGTVPDGEYTYKNTLMYFCCRNDGYSTIPIFLPTDTPFYLFQASRYGCQQVYDMRVNSEEIQWDDNNDGNKNKATGVVPFNKPTNSRGRNNWRLYFCYYYK